MTSPEALTWRELRAQGCAAVAWTQDDTFLPDAECVITDSKPVAHSLDYMLEHARARAQDDYRDAPTYLHVGIEDRDCNRIFTLTAKIECSP